MFGLAVFVVAVGSIVACHVLAGRRGANPVYWGVMGLLFGPFAIPFAMFAKPERRPRENSDY
jgi:hypothetical protein